jgi:phosphatidylinositol alpha-mannosyltransferase
MKIALVSPYDFPYPGGVTEHIVALAEGVRRRGHEVHVVAVCSGYQGQTFPNVRVVSRRVTRIPIGSTIARVGLSPLSYIRIRKILRHESFDVIHLQEPLTPSITWLVLLQARGLRHTATLGTFHAYHEQPNWFYAHGRPLFDKFFGMLDGLIAVSQAAYNFAYQMFPGNYHIIPNGIDLKRFGKRPEHKSHEASGPLTLLFVGRLDQRKGFPTLLQSYLMLKPHYPQLRLKVVGPFGPAQSRPYQQLAAAQQGTDIEFVGYVPPAQLPEFYHTADIFCAPSTGFESFGIVLLEAMAAHLPIVASDIAGYRSLLSDGQEGILVPPNQQARLAEALSRLIENRPMRQEMGHKGWVKANLYSWDHITDQILDVYWDTIYVKRNST